MMGIKKIRKAQMKKFNDKHRENNCSDKYMHEEPSLKEACIDIVTNIVLYSVVLFTGVYLLGMVVRVQRAMDSSTPEDGTEMELMDIDQ